jgi:hypothetical protein
VRAWRIASALTSTPTTDFADRGDDGRAVAFAAGDVEHPLSGGDRARQRVTMHVFVPDLAHALGREALTGERE